VVKIRAIKNRKISARVKRADVARNRGGIYIDPCIFYLLFLAVLMRHVNFVIETGVSTGVVGAVGARVWPAYFRKFEPVIYRGMWCGRMRGHLR
jgi:hypothetical protein